jgi:hypothetical protein
VASAFLPGWERTWGFGDFVRRVWELVRLRELLAVNELGGCVPPISPAAALVGSLPQLH